MRNKPEKYNTLSFNIGIEEFENIVSGKQKEAFREIKDNTANKYLLHFEDMLYVAPGTWDGEEEPDDVMLYNNGAYPFLPIQYEYLNLTTGSGSSKRSAMVSVTDIQFQPGQDDSGNVIRLVWTESEGFSPSKDGDLALWFVIYKIGEIVS